MSGEEGPSAAEAVAGQGDTTQISAATRWVCFDGGDDDFVFSLVVYFYVYVQ